MKQTYIKDFLKKINIKKTLKATAKWAGFFLLGGFILILLMFFYYTWNLPKPEKFTETPFIQSTKIYDRTGKVLLYDIFGEEKREIVPFEKISQNLKNSVIASEDARFYQHMGIDFEGILRAILVDLKLGEKSQGGSTITQQLIRSVYLTNQKSIARKVREVVLSIELEQKYSKEQIFDWYLNKIPFGENAYGAEAASQTYFSKPASDLSIAEAALLTAIIPAPSYYSPNGLHKPELLQRKDAILDKMYQQKFISEEQLKTAKNEKIVFTETTTSIKAPDFVLYVKKYLDDKYGEEYLREKGLKVYTSLDWDLQQYAEKTIKDADETNKAKKANNSAMVVINPKTGEILTLIGSKDYFADPYPKGCDEKPGSKCLFEPKYDVATMGQRQPGSAFKPFVYAAAFEKGFTPDTILWDAKTEFNPYCPPDGSSTTDQYGLGCYHPQNYDGKYRGKVSLKQALAGSLNLPSVKTLYLVGVKEAINFAKNFGITTLNNPDNYGLSLVLGGADINLMELTSAYGVFATEGEYIPPVSILKIEDSNKNIIEENKKQPTRVLGTQIARQINSILSDNNARAPVFGYNSPLHIEGYDVAVKTGTTQNLKDGWTMGYTPFAVVGTWVGNSDNTPTNDAGVGLAAPMWRKVMEKILSTNSPENFTPPEPATNSNPILLGQLPVGDTNTILYYIDKNNPLGPKPQNPSADTQYALWQIGINNWLISNGLVTPQTQNTLPENTGTGTGTAN